MGRKTFVLGNGLVPSVLDSQSLGAGFDTRTEVCFSFLSFFTCVTRVILTIPSPGELRLPNNMVSDSCVLSTSPNHSVVGHGVMEAVAASCDHTTRTMYWASEVSPHKYVVISC